MIDIFSYRTPLLFDRRNCDLPALLDAGRLGAGNVMQFTTMMNSDEFQALGLERRVTHYMFSSHYQLVQAQDVVASDPDTAIPTAQEKVIRALRADARLLEWDRRDIAAHALDLDHISVPALRFLLELYQEWLDPVFGASDEQIAFRAHDLGFALADFCQP